MSADEFREGNMPAMGRHALPYSATPQLTPWLLAAAPETSTILAPPSTMRTAAGHERRIVTRQVHANAGHFLRFGQPAQGQVSREERYYAIEIGIERLHQRTNRVRRALRSSVPPGQTTLQRTFLGP